MVFFAPFVTLSNFFIRPIFRTHSQEEHKHYVACHGNHEIGEVFKAVFNCLVHSKIFKNVICRLYPVLGKDLRLYEKRTSKTIRKEI